MKFQIGHKLNVGRIVSNETKTKLSLLRKGRKVSNETRKKISQSHFGIRTSEEAKIKIGLANKGRTAWNKGKTGVYSNDVLKKMGEKNKGRLITKEHKKKISLFLKGIPRSEETKKKISIGHIRKNRNIGYGGLHAWVKRHKIKSEFCEKCGITENRLELSNISGLYKRDINDFQWTCHKCNMSMPKSPIFRKVNGNSALIRNNEIKM